MSKRRGPIGTYFQYLPTYIEHIGRNPRVSKAMRTDPGARWMRRGNRIFIAIVVILFLIRLAQIS